MKNSYLVLLICAQHIMRVTVGGSCSGKEIGGRTLQKNSTPVMTSTLVPSWMVSSSLSYLQIHSCTIALAGKSQYCWKNPTLHPNVVRWPLNLGTLIFFLLTGAVDIYLKTCRTELVQSLLTKVLVHQLHLQKEYDVTREGKCLVKTFSLL